ncbi:MAG TPA: methylated-DNA--[protein]-cysteine S-methyltransferase [Opitutaceae bacterium]|nr:methylated-DNA--[protein]-cysteine S-methyltransferase [Opitutaceae bacterium]
MLSVSPETMNQHTFNTAIGPCRVEWQGDQLAGFRLPGDDVVLNPLQNAESVPEWVASLIARVQRHLAGELQDFALAPFAFEALTNFQREVYRAAVEVKPGQVETYGGLARRMGYPVSASRAVGTALGQNPWPLLVPCHRFVGADGKMTGFSAPGGIQTKLRLLAIEGAEMFGI